MKKNAKLLNIVYEQGTFGNFLKYFLERFSKKTPVMEQYPFTETGTSHSIADELFSGLIQTYHPPTKDDFIQDNKDETDLPICTILPTLDKHFLFLKQAQFFRARDNKVKPDFLWQKAVGEMPEMFQDFASQIIKLYDIKETAHFSWIPKFIVRDWYKLEFLKDLDKQGEYLWYDAFRSNDFFKAQKTFELDLESFFHWETFIKNIKELDSFHGLDLNFERLPAMKNIFERGLELDQIRQECNLVEQVIGHGADKDFGGLDVSTEAFIYATFEKKYPTIQMPLTNRFFRDSEEIRQFIEHFPNWYRRYNPNLG